jgi:hypothetical protein
MRAAKIGALVFAATLMVSVDVQAQGRGRGNGNPGNRPAATAQGSGPAFCRSGEGHPVHGWQWCREKGWDRAGRSVDRTGRIIDRNGRVITRDGGIVVVPETRDGDIAIPRRVPRRDDDDRGGGWWPF